MENIYIGKCEHLHCSDITDDDCLKRFVPFVDIFDGEHKRFVFCNDFLKLQIKQKCKSSIWYEHYLSDVFCKYYGLKNGFYNLAQSKTLKDYTVRLTFYAEEWNSFYVTKCFYFEDFLNSVLQNKSCFLQDNLVKNLIGFCDSLKTKVSQNKYKLLLSDVRKLNDYSFASSSYDEKTARIIEIINKINEIKINFLKQ